MTATARTLDRRQLLARGAGAVVGVGLASLGGSAAGQAAGAASAPAAAAKALPAYAAWKDAGAVIMHSANTIETKRSALGSSVITASDHLFVRNNLPPPDASVLADRDAWQVSIEGVKNPRTLSVGQLKAMGLETIATVLQCSGNGRGFFPHKPSGTQWIVGAAGCVIWSGIPVRRLVEELGGVAPGMRFLTGTGGEKLPAGIDPLSVIVERSMALKVADDAILAWEMNGMPLPLAHGGPLRLISPGYNGVNNIKYVKRVAFTSEETKARIMATSYRMTPVGEKSKPSEPSLQEMNVKSWVSSPAGDEPVKAGVVYVSGVAFSDGSPIRRVELSSDGGKTWTDAGFIGPDLGRFAWRQFALPMRLTAGKHVIVSRATDAAGQTQPERRVENNRGYANNSWLDHAATVTVG